MPLAPVLFIVFLVLKLTEVIAWSWVWVTAPLWIPFALFILVVLFGGSLAVFGLGISSARSRKRNGTIPQRRVTDRNYPR